VFIIARLPKRGCEDSDRIGIIMNNDVFFTLFLKEPLSNKSQVDEVSRFIDFLPKKSQDEA